MYFLADFGYALTTSWGYEGDWLPWLIREILIFVIFVCLTALILTKKNLWKKVNVYFAAPTLKLFTKPYWIPILTVIVATSCYVYNNTHYLLYHYYSEKESILERREERSLFKLRNYTLPCQKTGYRFGSTRCDYLIDAFAARGEPVSTKSELEQAAKYLIHSRELEIKNYKTLKDIRVVYFEVFLVILGGLATYLFFYLRKKS